MTNQEYLKSLHTNQLMDLRQRTFALNGLMRVQSHGQEFSLTSAEIKAELDTRPHVPNKQEAKAIRQAKARG